MPDWNQMLEELSAIEVGAINKFDTIRRRYLTQLHELTKRNVIIYYSGWLQKPDIAGTEINDEDKNGFMTALHQLDHRKGLDLILHTPGGQTGAAESLVDYLRAVFGTDIRAFVPQLALSGGTVIACGCKEVYMGKHSSLGPIDPQIGGIPAHGVIEEFKRASQDIKENPDTILVWQPILNKYPIAFIDRCEKLLEMVEEMVTVWLSTGMFEGEDQAVIVTDENGNAITDENGNHIMTTTSSHIAGILINAGIFKSHDRHIRPEDCLRIGLKIRLLEDEPDLQDAVLSVHHACIHTLAGTLAKKIIENHDGKAFIQFAPVTQP
jgi:ATP-dependent protease ClpP protease subunit